MVLATLGDVLQTGTSLLLLLVTGVYAWITKDIAKATRDSVQASQRPTVVLSVRFKGATAFPVVTNHGPGPAIGPVLVLSMLKNQASVDGYDDRSIALGSLSPHEDMWMAPRAERGGMAPTFHEWCDAVDELTLTGICTDVYGETHSVNQTVDLRVIRDCLEPAGFLQMKPDPDPGIKIIGKQVEVLAKALGGLEAEVVHFREDLNVPSSEKGRLRRAIAWARAQHVRRF